MLLRLKAHRAQQVDATIDVALLNVLSFIAVLRDGFNHWQGALSLAATVVLLWLAARRLLRQYDPKHGRGPRGDFALTFVLLVGILAPAWVVAAAGWLPFEPRHVARLAAPLVPLVLLARWLLVGVALCQSRPTIHVLVAGIGPLGRLTGNEIFERGGPHHVIGFLRFEDEVPHDRLCAPLLGTVTDLDAVLRAHVVDEVFFGTKAVAHGGAVQAALRTCEQLGVPFALPACGYRLDRARPCTRGVRDGYVHFSTVRHVPVQYALKRAFDIALSSTMLVLLFPLLFVVAVAVKLESRGPVLFRQQRVGLRGRPFAMLKFRSMVVDAEARQAALMAQNEQSGPVFKMARDPRVTRVGRFIRRYSIDELPQLVNVLRGDMAVVGPRPPLASEVERYEAWQRRRLSVRPGITCGWQVSGRNKIGFEEWMLLDLHYIDNWRFQHDLALVLKTVPAVLGANGAS
jgi:exopolysaccharide biosynthesis polyprenyl glycosylphosphotransferase